MKVALVYDRVNKFGGAERVLLTLHQLWPDAPLFTSVYNRQTAPWASALSVVPSFLQHIPKAREHHELYPWLTPLVFESFDFRHFDLVVSITSAEAKGIITRPETLHICYCLTPTRYLWSAMSIYRSKPGVGVLDSVARLVYPLISPPLRHWDQIAAHRPDLMVAISKTVAKRIEKYYGFTALVIYPPVDTDFFTPVEQEPAEFFLVVSRLVPYKHVDIVVQAFNEVGWPLVIVGKGSEENYLRRLAKDNINFVSDLTDAQLLSYYRRCRALVNASVEDFGIVSLEAQACGRPVLALGKGGFVETIIPGKTGDFFFTQTKNALINCLTKFTDKRYSSVECRRNALRFNISRFKKELIQLVETNLTKRSSRL